MNEFIYHQSIIDHTLSFIRDHWKCDPLSEIHNDLTGPTIGG